MIDTDYDAQHVRNAIERLVSLQVPGAAFLTSQMDAASRKTLAEKGICAVYLDHGAAGSRASGIAIDYRSGTLSAVEHLANLGHRRIAFIGGPAHGASAKLRKAAFLEGIETVPGVEPRVIDSDFSVPGGYFSYSRLLKGFDATAVMAANDLMAIGALHYAYDARIAVPSELSIVGFDDITFSQFTQPALTTVAVQRAEIGRIAFELLWDLITDAKKAGIERAIETTLLVRQTTGPARTPKS